MEQTQENLTHYSFTREDFAGTLVGGSGGKLNEQNALSLRHSNGAAMGDGWSLVRV